jgi:hypothetical protein
MPEVPNPRFCKNGALYAKRFISYSNTVIARNHEMWDRRLWHWAPHLNIQLLPRSKHFSSHV